MSKLFTSLFSFRGRASRLEWWLPTLFACLCALLLDDVMEDLEGAVPALATLALIAFAFALAWTWLAASIKRLHEINKSGWWLVLGLIPVAGPLVLLVMLGIEPGSPWRNEYGPSKTPAPTPFDTPHRLVAP